MTTFKWMLGLFCLLFPTRVEGRSVNPAVTKGKTPDRAPGKIIGKLVEHADQNACGTSRP